MRKISVSYICKSLFLYCSASLPVLSANGISDKMIVELGDNSAAKANFAVAVGRYSQANAEKSISLGASARAIENNSTALGANATTLKPFSVALGAGSVADRGAGIEAYMPETKRWNPGDVVKSRMSDKQLNRLMEIDKIISAYNSQGTLSAEETKQLEEVKKERADMFATYMATHDAVSVGVGATTTGRHAVTRQITSVAAGSVDTDAVNVAQLRDLQTVTEKADAALDKRITNNTSAITKNLQVVNSNISENSKQISTNTLGIRENTQRIRDEGQARIRGDRETLRAATGYTDMRVNGLERNTNKRFAQLKEDIDKNRKRADAGIAGAMAMTGIPSVPGKKVSFGMAMAGYRSEGAVAAGFHFNTSENSAVKVNAAWDTENGAGVSAGMALGW
ncbi:YadA-like family protein [Escherichia coli]|uniref:YadA-like family protein n=1 Tax=Escherichia coli TaxID=562 RepID=UPI00107BDEFF|nr:YadA-like family protein [Escherichia coli]EEC8145017.1 hemagglutinin [Escherichia coli]EEQ4619639.1 hemagglutinin [Escherichia coli]EEQ7473245.1 hemagglutinin [Escherichia coli]EER3513972.1 hemagglutinin [Escherichia coli]EES1530763.1 hemagglutinin [Escherichia coli]